MRIFSKRLRFSWWALALGMASQVLACADNDEPPLVCPLLGCVSGENVSLSLSLPMTEIRELSLTFCRDELCYRGELASLPDDLENGVYLPATPEQRSNEAVPSLSARVEGASVVLAWGFSVSDNSAFEEGAVVRALLERSGGEVVFEREVVARDYEPVYPNGRECDRFPNCHRKAIALGGV